MTVLFDVHGLVSAFGNVGGAAVDYSYVFGTRQAGVRHDPQSHRVVARKPADLREISALLTKRPVENAA